MSFKLTEEQLLRNRPNQDVNMSSNPSFQLIHKTSSVADELPSVSRLQNLLTSDTASEPLKFTDGLVGAILSRTSEFLTSPNVDYLPEPPHGSTRDLYRRKDGRYGHDDPLCWPQPFNLKYPFYAAIPKQPTDGDWLACLMWLTLADHNVEFTQNRGSQRLGVLHKDVLVALDRKIAKIRPRVKVFLDEFKEHAAFLDENLTTIDVCLARISSTPSSLRDLQRGLSEVQRAYLVTKSFIDYERQHRRVQSSLVPASTDKTRMGCFVWDDRHANLMVKLGYPVFFLRPCTSFDCQVVLKVVALTHPSFPGVESAPADPPYPPILTSQAGSDEKFGAIRKASVECFPSLSPFENVHLPNAYPSSHILDRQRIYSPIASPASTSTSVPAAPLRPRPQLKHKPKTRKNPVNPPKAQRDVFADLPSQDPFAPPDILAWRGVNLTVVRHSRPPQKKRLPVPDPGLFFGSAERQSDFFHQWNHFRPAWRHVLTARHAAQPVDVWRKLLAYKHLRPLEAGVVMTPQIAAAEDARKLVKSSIKDFDPSMAYLPSTDGPFDRARAQYLIRELSLVNFHYELSYVDSVKDASQPIPGPSITVEELDRTRALHKRSRRVLIDGSFGGHQAVPERDRNTGLASTDWSERYTALKAFWRLLDTWHGEKPAIWGRGIDMDLSRLEGVGQEWERVLTQFYVQQAYNVLGYPPNVPYRI